MKWFRNHEQSKESAASLLAQYKSTGDLSYLGQLYSFYLPYVFGVCLHILPSNEQAEDAVMEIFELLIHKVRKHEIRNFKSWLHSVARNHCLAKLRKEKKVKNGIFATEIMQSLELSHPTDEDDEDKLGYLQECLAKLEQRQHRSIQLFYLEGHNYEEVAQMMDIDKNKVRSYLQNGRRNLRNCINRKNEGAH